MWLVSIVAVRKSPKLLAVVRFHHESPGHGLVVKWDNGGFASLNWEFDSPSVHQKKNSESEKHWRLQETVNLPPYGIRGSNP